MSDSEDDSSPSGQDDASDRENREAEEDFTEGCARAVVRLCHRHHFEMLTDKGHSQRSASSIQGHLASRCSSLPWSQVRDHVLGLLPVALQNALRQEIDRLGSHWEIPFLPNDAYLVRRAHEMGFPDVEEAVAYAKELLCIAFPQNIQGNDRIVETLIKHSKYRRPKVIFEFLVRSMPVEQRITFLAWLGEWRVTKRRRQS